jgi:deoxyribodipyrimidine photo-lyase
MDDILVWFRRDLRWRDNTALANALRDARRVHAVFVFDAPLLAHLPTRRDRRVAFISGAVTELDQALRSLGRRAGGPGGGLLTVFGDPCRAVPELARALGVSAVYANRDYAPDAVKRDRAVAKTLAAAGISWADFKDHVVFEHDELLTGQSQPYRVFTPYLRAWRRQLFLAAPELSLGARASALQPASGPGVTLGDIGFSEMTAREIGVTPGETAALKRADDFFDRIDRYHEARDFPALAATSRLSTDLRFGTLSIRQLLHRALQHGGQGAEKWIAELAWRDFYQGLLAADPALVDHCFKRACDSLVWNDWPAGFAAWQRGETGYPLIDAAMRELAQSGTMHNRLRMVCASFLCKDLGIDWRYGERHFAEHLLDYDQAANNGGWQWSASTGCDAQPWFRIFNPVSQGKRFDPTGAYVRQCLPALARVPDRYVHAPWTMSGEQQSRFGCVVGRDLPPPIVDHAAARLESLARFRAVPGSPTEGQ